MSAAQLPHKYPPRGGKFRKGKKSPLLKRRGNLGGNARDNSFLTFSLLISEDFWLFLDLLQQWLSALSAHLSEGTKKLRSLRKERKTQTSSLIGKEQVNKVWMRVIACQSLLPDSGESIYAARHLDVSQGLLAMHATSSRLRQPSSGCRAPAVLFCWLWPSYGRWQCLFWRFLLRWFHCEQSHDWACSNSSEPEMK